MSKIVTQRKNSVPTPSKKPLTNRQGEVRDLSRVEQDLFKPAVEVLPAGLLKILKRDYLRTK
jgi:hypothetical protein